MKIYIIITYVNDYNTGPKVILYISITLLCTSGPFHSSYSHIKHTYLLKYHYFTLHIFVTLSNFKHITDVSRSNIGLISPYSCLGRRR